MNLRIPVGDLGFWNQSQISRALSDILYYLTEDYWTFEFIERISSNTDQHKQIEFSFDTPDATCIALFSGGLDSFAGAVKQLSNSHFTKSFLISVVTNHRMRGVQKKLAHSIKKALNIDLIDIPLAVYLRSPKPAESLQKKSQRTRGFIFTVLGSIFSILAGKQSLNLFENGIGAINLPMVDFQIGTENTRSVNPVTLHEISNFMSEVTEASFEIENRGQWLTKAEICTVLSHSVLRDDIRSTVSCDGGFSRRVRGRTHCGYCTSCLLRRQALFSAGLSAKDADYDYDIFNMDPMNELNRLLPLRAMRNQVRKLEACLKADNPWHELSKNFPA